MKKLILTSALVFSACAQEKENKTKPTMPVVSEVVSATNDSESPITSGKLGGTYHNAGKDAPIIIMVPGSGPTDKDGNSIGFVSNMFKFLAEDLGRAGISTVRVDKHGLYSSSASGEANAASVELYADNYRAWAKTITEKSGQSCVFLLGHSEGGLMVTAAAIDQENICAVITVASPGHRLSDVLRKQLKDNPANKPVLSDAMAAIDKLEVGEKVDVTDMHPALKQLFVPSVQDFLISMFKVDPAELLSQVSVPKLVIQGTHDIQVSVDDAKRLSEVGGAELVLLDGLSHILKPAPEERMPNIMTYNSPDTPIDPGVSQAIIDFVQK